MPAMYAARPNPEALLALIWTSCGLSLLIPEIRPDVGPVGVHVLPWITTTVYPVTGDVPGSRDGAHEMISAVLAEMIVRLAGSPGRFCVTAPAVPGRESTPATTASANASTPKRFRRTIPPSAFRLPPSPNRHERTSFPFSKLHVATEVNPCQSESQTRQAPWPGEHADRRGIASRRGIALAIHVGCQRPNPVLAVANSEVLPRSPGQAARAGLSGVKGGGVSRAHPLQFRN